MQMAGSLHLKAFHCPAFKKHKICPPADVCNVRLIKKVNMLTLKEKPLIPSMCSPSNYAGTMRLSQMSWVRSGRWRRVWSAWSRRGRPPRPVPAAPTAGPATTARSACSWPWMWSTWENRLVGGPLLCAHLPFLIPGPTRGFLQPFVANCWSKITSM